MGWIGGCQCRIGYVLSGYEDTYLCPDKINGGFRKNDLLFMAQSDGSKNLEPDIPVVCADSHFRKSPQSGLADYAQSSIM